MSKFIRYKTEIELDARDVLAGLFRYYYILDEDTDILKKNLRRDFKTYEGFYKIIKFLNYTAEDFVECLITVYKFDLFTATVVKKIREYLELYKQGEIPIGIIESIQSVSTMETTNPTEEQTGQENLPV